MSAIDEIAAERKRQIEVEGFNAAHDDDHTSGDLAQAAGCYALHACLQLDNQGRATDRVPTPWPWEAEWWKPKDPRRNLIRAAALIVAEIERIDRATPKERG